MTGNVSLAGTATATGLSALLGTSGDVLLSLAICLTGVALSRTVFVDRQDRDLGRKQRWRETLPLTMVAMLIAGVIVVDNHMGLSKAAFTGLGVGWTAVLLLDLLGRRLLEMIGGRAAATQPTITDDMADDLHRIDRADARRKD